MPRKAKIVSASNKLVKNSVVTMEIMENYLEPHFAALQEDSIILRQEMDRRFKEVKDDIGHLRLESNQKYETTLKALIEILNGQSKEIKNIKEDSWSLDKRVTKLEKQLA